jgi:hypothetical protein
MHYEKCQDFADFNPELFTGSWLHIERSPGSRKHFRFNLKTHEKIAPDHPPFPECKPSGSWNTENIAESVKKWRKFLARDFEFHWHTENDNREPFDLSNPTIDITLNDFLNRYN